MQTRTGSTKERKDATGAVQDGMGDGAEGHEK